MKRACMILGVLALAFPASALAKEVTKLEVCGASGCASTTDRAALQRMGEGSNGETPAATPGLQPYYRLVYTVDAGTESFQFTNFYLPAAKVTRGIDQSRYTHFYSVSQQFADGIASLAAGLEPFPTPTILRVTIGRRVAADPQSYARLLTIKGREGYVATRAWQRIKFSTGVQSPWSRDGTILEFTARGGYLAREGRYLKLPKDMAARIKAGKSLDAATSRKKLGFVAGGLGGAALLLAGTAAALRRRRPFQKD